VHKEPGSNLATAPTSVMDRCPVEVAIEVIGGKWKLLLLRALLLDGPKRYNELLASVNGISAKELTRNLRELAASKRLYMRPHKTRKQPSTA
jgi:DNA-binding HxlR family transcriptional regulator